MEWIVRYKGVDWLGMIFAMLSLFYLAKHRKRGFLLGLLCNLCWMVFGVMTESAGNIIANLAYAMFNIHGWRKWREDGQQCPKTV